MTGRRSGELNAMDSPRDFHSTCRGAGYDDVTSLDSWGELDPPSPVLGTQLSAADHALPKPSHKKKTHYKQKIDGSNAVKRKDRSKSALVNSNSGSSNFGGTSSTAEQVKSGGNIVYDDSRKVNKNSHSKHEVSSRYSSNDPIMLNPGNLEYISPMKSSVTSNSSHYIHSSGSTSLPFQPSSGNIHASYESSGSSTSDTAGSSAKKRSNLKTKRSYIQSKLQSNPGDLAGEEDFMYVSRDVRLNTEAQRWEDKHRSSESIYSSTEQSQSLNKGSRESDSPGDLDQLFEQSEKVKTKLMSMWNNMKYGWTIKTKTQFRFDSPIYLLGKCYHIRKEEDVETDAHLPQHHRPTHPQLSYRMTEMEAFKRDFTSRLWFTYRRDFPQLPHSSLTTDCGWGCMLRSGQMMLAQAFIDHFLSRDWRLFNHQTKEQQLYHKQIIRWFSDFPSDQSPFSIHALVQLGEKTGKRPGDWYGPASVAHILKEAISKAYEYQPILNDIAIYVSQDCTVYKQDILDLCANRRRSSTRLSCSTDSPTSPQPFVCAEQDWKRGVIILIPVRLGSDALNPVYIPCLKSLLTQDCCLGIIGGKPRHSLYFIGWQEDKLIHLDPHYCQDVIDTKSRDFNIATFHCMSPRKMSFNKMDPSCTIGFYCKSKEDFNKFIEQTEEMVLEPKYKGLYPMFIFSEGSCSDINLEGLSIKEDKLLRIRHVNTATINGKPRSRTIESEEFVFL
ncbi:cysteine protease ATG4C-like [Liolophura sinensis]|uniref:cysteine protease ATG4C-like n=1 Tax=Liolophura sinensis TaxID=3198878 RepID=UPI003158D211